MTLDLFAGPEIAPGTSLPADSSPTDQDYRLVRDAIELMSERWREQPTVEALAGKLGVTPVQLQRLLVRWAGLTPKAFLQARKAFRVLAGLHGLYGAEMLVKVGLHRRPIESRHYKKEARWNQSAPIRMSTLRG